MKEASPNIEIIETIDLFLNESGELLLQDKIVTLLDIKNIFLQNKSLQVSVKIFPDAGKEIKDKIFSDLRTIGIKKITLCTSQSDDSINQQKATPEEVAEYNKLASQHNDKPENLRIIKQKDFERMEYLYKKMSKEQKANAEPFPNFPPPPPPPAQKGNNAKDIPPPPPIPADATPEQKKKMQAIIDDYDTNVPPPPPPIPADATPAQKNKMQAIIDDYDTNVPPPPPPPAPKAPLDYVIEMAKKDATFYYEDKSISSDKAIELLKKNNDLNIQSKESDSKNPKIYISKEPVIIKQ